MKRTYILILVIIILALAAGGRLLVWHTHSSQTPGAPAGTIPVAGFHKDAACAALIPSCGYCPGEIVGSTCYVTQDEFDEYKKVYPDLNAGD